MSENQPKQRNLPLDLFKIFLAFLVVCIHFVKYRYVHHALYRIAVPTFFMISGYFLYKKDENVRSEKAKGFIKHTASYMLFALAFYAVYNFAVCLIDGTDPSKFFLSLYQSDVIRNFVLLNSNPLGDAYHLWFIIALFFVSILHFLIVKYNKERWYYFIIPICLAVSMFFNAYVKKVGGTSVGLFYTRNALFFGLPLFGLGYVLAKFNFHPKRWLKFIYLALGLLFFFLQVVESKRLIMELYPSSIASSSFLLLFFVGLKPTKKGQWYYRIFGKSMPFYIYVLHLGVGMRLAKHIVIASLYINSLAIFILSVGIYLIGYHCINGIKFLHKKFVCLKTIKTL